MVRLGRRHIPVYLGEADMISLFKDHGGRLDRGEELLTLLSNSLG